MQIRVFKDFQSLYLEGENQQPLSYLSKNNQLLLTIEVLVGGDETTSRHHLYHHLGDSMDDERELGVSGCDH